MRHFTSLALAFIVMATCATAADEPYRGDSFTRTTIYHSPQTPGWTSWAGAWVMPDQSLMVSFTQATGPVGDPEERKKTRSYAGLHVSVVYLRSADASATWTKVADSDVGLGTGDSGLGTHANNSPATFPLKDGALVRRVYGWDYGKFPALPGTAFLQVSRDMGKTWSAAPVSSDEGRSWSDPAPVQEFLLDPAKYTVQPTRARRLRDGRILMGGGVWNGPHTQKAPYEPLLVVSDDEACSWKRVNFAGPNYEPIWNTKWNEWDFAELESGDLLVVSRTSDNKERWRGLLAKKGATWEMREFGPTVLPHSGHPELLKLRERPVLHIATTGTHWSTDAGQTWNPLTITKAAGGAPTEYRSMYYPHSLQTADGWIYVFSHKGSDNAFGQVDQYIVMDRFRVVDEHLGAAEKK